MVGKGRGHIGSGELGGCLDMRRVIGNQEGVFGDQ